MNYLYKLVHRDGLPFPAGIAQPYSNDNTIVFGGILGEYDERGYIYIWVDNVPTIQEQAKLINEKYQPQLDVYKDNLLTAMTSNGTSQQTKITICQTQYNALLAKKNAELEALNNG